MKTSSRLQEVTQELSMADDSMSVFTFSDQKTMWNIYENDIHHSDGCQSLVLCWVAISLNTDKIPDRFIALNRSYLPGMVNPFWHSVGHVCHWHVTTQNFTISVRYLSVTAYLFILLGNFGLVFNMFFSICWFLCFIWWSSQIWSEWWIGPWIFSVGMVIYFCCAVDSLFLALLKY